MRSDTIRDNFYFSKFLSCSLISPYENFKISSPQTISTACKNHPQLTVTSVTVSGFCLFSPCFLLLHYFYLSAQFFATKIIPPASSWCLPLILLRGLLTINLFWSVTMAFSCMVLFPPSLYRASESSFLSSFHAKGF